MSSISSDIKLDLLQASRDGDLNSIKVLLKDKGTNIEQCDNAGNTPLILAAANGHKDCVIELLNNKANLHALSTFNRNALWVAAANGHKDIVSILVDHGSKVDACDRIGENTPLLIATLHGYLECVKILLKEKVDVNAINKSKETALHLAAKRGHENIIPILIAYGAKLELNDKLGNSPLTIAAQFKSAVCVKNLLSAKANPNVQNATGTTPLRWSQILNCKDIESLLQSHGAKPSTIKPNL